MLAQERRRRRELEAAVAAALLLVGKRATHPLAETAIVAHLQRAIESGQLDSWAAGARAAQRDIRWIERETGLKLAATTVEPNADELASRAAQAAGNYGRAVRKKARELAADGSETPLADSVESNAWRLDRTATTENASAFNGSRAETVREAAREAEIEIGRARDQGARVGVQLVEIWDATLDDRTCPVCGGLDGTEADDRGYFAGGATPGDVHGNCRCTSHFELVH